MSDLYVLLRYIPVIIVALILGRWFNKEREASQKRGEHWARVYFVSVPGIIIWVIIGALLVLRTVAGD